MLDVYLNKPLAASVSNTIEYRHPRDEHGTAVYSLIQQCPPLDQNSRYCNLLQCTHFSDTSMAAFDGDRLVGFVSGYVLPKKPDSLFIWQVAVLDDVRGKGVAIAMILALLKRPACDQVQFIETTITMQNQPSWNMFEKLAKTLNTCSDSKPHFFKDTHFSGHHDTEMLLRIGPFGQNV